MSEQVIGRARGPSELMYSIKEKENLGLMYMRPLPLLRSPLFEVVRRPGLISGDLLYDA